MAESTSRSAGARPCGSAEHSPGRSTCPHRPSGSKAGSSGPVRAGGSHLAPERPVVSHPGLRAAPGSAFISQLGWTEVARSLKISGRELEIVRAVFDNLAEHTIAADLGISEYTVHSHMRRLFHKLRATTRTGLALRVMREFLALIASPGSALPPICRYRKTGLCPLEKQ